MDAYLWPNDCRNKMAWNLWSLMFGDSIIVPTRFDLKVLSEYKNILSKLFF